METTSRGQFLQIIEHSTSPVLKKRRNWGLSKTKPAGLATVAAPGPISQQMPELQDPDTPPQRSQGSHHIGLSTWVGWVSCSVGKEREMERGKERGSKGKGRGGMKKRKGGEREEEGSEEYERRRVKRKRKRE